MKIIRVQYTTTQQYAAINKQNIEDITNELRAIGHPGIKYSACLLPDGKTFMHFDQFENEKAHEFLMELESFKKSQAELKASQLEAEPQWEPLELVASSFDFFG
jgi:hypothetical protein